MRDLFIIIENMLEEIRLGQPALVNDKGFLVDYSYPKVYYMLRDILEMIKRVPMELQKPYWDRTRILLDSFIDTPSEDWEFKVIGVFLGREI